MTTPTGATHISPNGVYYHERGDGQYMYWSGVMGKWSPSPAANRGEIDLKPLSKSTHYATNCADLPVTEEEDEAWDERRIDTLGQNGNDGLHYDAADVAFPKERPLLSESEQKALGIRDVGTSDGSTASYYELPEGATELQDLISYRNLNAQDGEMFRAIYRKGRASHSDELRDAKKVLFYAQAEVKRLEALK